MKAVLGLFAVVLLGVALGVGVAKLRIESSPWKPAVEESAARPAAKPEAEGPMPKVVVDQDEFRFGTLDLHASGTHEFEFRNEGDAPLVLTEGGTSCRCTLSELKEKEIPPGGSAKVTISWKPTDSPGPYRQTATILTNDPKTPKVTLTVSGQITTAIRLSPHELVFSRISVGESATAEAKLFYYLDEPLKILGHEWSEATSAEHFRAEVTPLPAEEIKAEPDAREGWRVKVTLKADMPPGPIQQKLILRTDLASSPTLTLPIEGVVGSEIAVAGPGWDPDKGILNLGTVLGREGAKRRLMLVVRGASRQNVEFKIGQVVPDFLKVTLGERSEINKGAVIQVPLTIEIPPNSPSSNHLGSEQGKLGEVLLETTHPKVPALRILVRFAVEG